ncbi:hypothetical protein MASR2M47_07830 [Draconibacterium sp.]
MELFYTIELYFDIQKQLIVRGKVYTPKLKTKICCFEQQMELTSKSEMETKRNIDKQKLQLPEKNAMRCENQGS